MATSRNAPTPTGFCINVGGKSFAIKDELVEVSSLKLDVRNPRLHSELGLLARNGDVTEVEIEEKIWSQNDTKQLFKQILADGGLIEPPFVRFDGTVSEGNRRLVCLRKILSDKDVEEGQSVTPEQRRRFEKVYVHRIPNEVSEHDILKLLLDWHVSSKKPWSKPDQTEILHRLYKGGTTIDELARRTREGPDKMTNRLDAYEMLLAHRERTKDKATSSRVQSNLLSHYRQLLENETLGDWVKAEGNHELFDGWVENKQVANIKDTRDRLEVIVSDEDGIDLLVEEEMTVKNAYAQLDRGRNKVSAIFDEMDEWTTRVQDISLKAITELKESKTKQRKLKKLQEALAEVDAQVNSMKEAV